jgi:dTDP-4-amino-4,6-dideoxygalactose transaminase
MYREQLAELEGCLTLPGAEPDAIDSGHIFYVLARSVEEREGLRQFLLADGIHAVTHYVPLHSSPAGRRFGRAHGSLIVTERVGETVLRLPLFNTMTDAELGRVCERVRAFFRE